MIKGASLDGDKNTPAALSVEHSGQAVRYRELKQPSVHSANTRGSGAKTEQIRAGCLAQTRFVKLVLSL